MPSDKFWRCFHEIYEDLPRQGPGDRASTERALGLLPPLTPSQRILDIGCGTGAQTLDLARATEAGIVAVDHHAPFVARLQRRIAELGYGDRVEARVGDMNDLPFPDGSFDVIWSEGSIFIMGFAWALEAWRRLLVPGGYLVVSDFCWLTDDPAPELKDMFLDDGSDVTDVPGRRSIVAACGYRLLQDFVLPDEGWWDNYHVPLGRRLVRFREAHAGDAEALEVAERSQREIELCRTHRGAFGYVFFVMQRDDGSR